MTATSGTTLRIAATIASRPVERAPSTLVAWKNSRNPTATSATAESLDKAGTSRPTAAPPATATAASAAQVEIQKAKVVRKATNGPNACSI